VIQRIASFIGLMCLAVVSAAQSPDLSSIVSRMVVAEHDNTLHAYTVKRDYRLLDKQMEPKAQVVANITFVPPDLRQYEIESAQGGIFEKIVRDILARETEPVTDLKHKEVSPANYEFHLLGTATMDGRACYVLSIAPRRNEKYLIRGKIWVDAETYRIRRAEGQPAKSPSWWLHDVYILMLFAEVDGMWLRTFTHATANVRFKGRYEMDARDLEYRPATSATVRGPGILAGAVLGP
jgi:hypothetical protein